MLNTLEKIEIINPPNILKKKVGSGGIDPSLIRAAQRKMYQNSANFFPLAEKHMRRISELLGNRERRPKDILRDVSDCVGRMKAQGAMFDYPLVTEVSAMLMNFLPQVEKIDADILEILAAYQTTVRTVITRNLRGPKTAEGQELVTELEYACARYYKYRFLREKKSA